MRLFAQYGKRFSKSWLAAIPTCGTIGLGTSLIQRESQINHKDGNDIHKASSKDWGDSVLPPPVVRTLPEVEAVVEELDDEPLITYSYSDTVATVVKPGSFRHAGIVNSQTHFLFFFFSVLDCLFIFIFCFYFFENSHK